MRSTGAGAAGAAAAAVIATNSTAQLAPQAPISLPPHLGLAVPAGLAAAGDAAVHDVVSHKKGRLQLNVNKLFLKGCASQIVLAF